MKEGGPGGCRSKEDCESYCENPDNMMECVKFAKENGLIDPKEAEMIQKMPLVGPGGCRGKECKTFCDNPEHAEECLAFAEKNDLMPKEEIERAKKFVGKLGPGGCKGPEECRAFCESPDNKDSCFQFAVDNDLMPKDEIEKIKKIKDVMREGGPGGCKSGQECRAYCENSDNQEKCFEFAKEHKLMSPEEAEHMGKMREMSGKVMEIGGPGGCKSEKECRAYCGNPEHVEECLAFAVKMGGMQIDDAKDKLKMFIERPMMNQQGMMAPPRFKEMEQEKFERFEQFRQMEISTSFIMRQAPMPIGGPGGCGSPEVCMKYCADPSHRDECARFNPSAGGLPPGEMFRQIETGTAGIYGRSEDFERCGPQPPVALQAGCRLVCRDSKWESICANKAEDLTRCGPRPAMPTPQGCVGPVCKDGRWDFECKDFSGEDRSVGKDRKSVV